jgi:hypothetical protein
MLEVASVLVRNVYWYKSEKFWQVIISRWVQEVFCFPKPSRPTVRPSQPRIQLVPGFIPGGKLAEAWRWSLYSFSAEIRNDGDFITVILLYAFMMWTAKPLHIILFYEGLIYSTGRIHWPNDLWRMFAAARLLKVRVRILPGLWLSLVNVCRQVEVLVTGRFLVQRSPADCDVSFCFI